MIPAAGQLALLALGVVLAACQALENSTSPLSDSPVAAAVVSHFNECPDSHTQFCFHGTCRFLVQEEKPACVCEHGYMGARCEHADLLAVVAASQKKQAITALVVVSVVALAVLIITCVLIHGLMIPEEEFGQVAYGSPTKKRPLQNNSTGSAQAPGMSWQTPPKYTVACTAFCPSQTFKTV